MHPRRSFAQAAMESRLVVGIYESRLWRRSPWLAFILGIGFDEERAVVLRALDLRPDHAVLDLACGPGNYSRAIARAAARGRTIGLDLSAPMLALADRRARAAGLANLTVVRGSAQDLPFPDASFDAVSCCGAFHLFPDPTRVLGEVRRVLRPGGRFVTALARRGDGRLGSVLGWGARRMGVAPVGEAELGARLAAAGFEAAEVHHARRVWMIWSARTAAVQG